MSTLADPKRNARGQISTEPSELWGELTPIAARFGVRLRWNYGVGEQWRIILSTATEAALTEFVSSGRYAELGRECLSEIQSSVFGQELTLWMELDSDERVEAEEGWSFRLRSDPAPDRQFLLRGAMGPNGAGKSTLGGADGRR